MPEASRSVPKRCAARRKDGEPCAAPVLDGGPFCYMHDPARREAQAAARQRGGENSATVARAEKLVPNHMRPVLGAVLAAIRDVRAGSLTPAQGSAIASLAGAACKVYQLGILEERLSALEDQREGVLTP